MQELINYCKYMTPIIDVKNRPGKTLNGQLWKPVYVSVAIPDEHSNKTAVKKIIYISTILHVHLE